jgi:hypothetical protein
MLDLTSKMHLSLVLLFLSAIRAASSSSPVQEPAACRGTHSQGLVIQAMASFLAFSIFTHPTHMQACKRRRVL